MEKTRIFLGVLLYGSVTKGKTREESDIDLVISENSSLADDEYQISMRYEVVEIV